jgi:hypothetical protein
MPPGLDAPADGTFDLAYSAQAIYHIDTADGQAAAFHETMRVRRPCGRAIFVMANPFPILFPYRNGEVRDG